MKALEGFKAGSIEVLVLRRRARGLDIVELPVVINYDVRFARGLCAPHGRTGRAAPAGLTIMMMTGRTSAALRPSSGSPSRNSRCGRYPATTRAWSERGSERGAGAQRA